MTKWLYNNITNISLSKHLIAEIFKFASQQSHFGKGLILIYLNKYNYININTWLK